MRGFVWGGLALVALGGAGLLAPGEAWGAKALPRYFPQLRPLLMGDANVAVGDEASTVFYNPAGIADLPMGSYQIGLPIPLLDLGPILADALIDPDKVSKKYQNLDQNDLRSLLGTRLYSNVVLPLSFVQHANGIAWGTGIDILTNAEVLGNPVLPGLHLELHADYLAFFTYSGHWGPNLAVGITPKVVQRVGIDKVFTFGELFASGGTLDLDSNPAFQDVKNGVSYTGGGVDLGFLYRFDFWPEWHPRFGMSALNIGGYDQETGLRGIQFGKRPTPSEAPIGGEIAQINSLGFALSPTYNGIRYTVALDVVDITRTVLPGNDWAKRTRLGVEIGLGIKDVGTALFSVLAGLNATHPSVGVLSRVWIFEVGFGTYEVELGNEAGDSTEKRTVLELGLRF
ncbi:MAG TPA: hypothetical protein VF678_02135 [bacterium]